MIGKPILEFLTFGSYTNPYKKGPKRQTHIVFYILGVREAALAQHSRKIQFCFEKNHLGHLYEGLQTLLLVGESEGPHVHRCMSILLTLSPTTSKLICGTVNSILVNEH